MSANDFEAALAKRVDAWKGAAKAAVRSGTDYGPPDIPNGKYEAVLSVVSGVVANGKHRGTPYVEIKATICSGEYEGQEPRAFYLLDGSPPRGNGVLTAEERLVGDLKALCPDVDVEAAMNENPVGAISQLLEEVNALVEPVTILVKNRVGKEGTAYAGQRFQDVYFQRRK